MARTVTLTASEQVQSDSVSPQADGGSSPERPRRSRRLQGDAIDQVVARVEANAESMPRVRSRTELGRMDDEPTPLERFYAMAEEVRCLASSQHTLDDARRGAALLEHVARELQLWQHAPSNEASETPLLQDVLNAVRQPSAEGAEVLAVREWVLAARLRHDAVQRATKVLQRRYAMQARSHQPADYDEVMREALRQACEDVNKGALWCDLEEDVEAAGGVGIAGRSVSMATAWSSDVLVLQDSAEPVLLAAMYHDSEAMGVMPPDVEPGAVTTPFHISKAHQSVLNKCRVAVPHAQRVLRESELTREDVAVRWVLACAHGLRALAWEDAVLRARQHFAERSPTVHALSDHYERAACIAAERYDAIACGEACNNMFRHLHSVNYTGLGAQRRAHAAAPLSTHVALAPLFEQSRRSAGLGDAFAMGAEVDVSALQQASTQHSEQHSASIAFEAPHLEQFDALRSYTYTQPAFPRGQRLAWAAMKDCIMWRLETYSPVHCVVRQGHTWAPVAPNVFRLDALEAQLVPSADDDAVDDTSPPPARLTERDCKGALHAYAQVLHTYSKELLGQRRHRARVACRRPHAQRAVPHSNCAGTACVCCHCLRRLYAKRPGAAQSVHLQLRAHTCKVRGELMRLDAVGAGGTRAGHLFARHSVRRT